MPASCCCFGVFWYKNCIDCTVLSQARFLVLRVLDNRALLSPARYQSASFEADQVSTMPVSMIDVLWLVLCAGLVFNMQIGFLCLESGLTRSKNAINVAVKNMAT